jgi:hypothetical protein
MKNNINKVSISTGGGNLRQDAKDSEVEGSSLGLAKASPNFKPIDAKSPEDMDAERKAIASNTKPVKD